MRRRSAAAADVPRVSQLTLRTNQFNLTTRRAATRRGGGTAGRPGRHRARGAFRRPLRRQRTRRRGVPAPRRDVLHIDNFLLSCRVFSRGVETATLRRVLRHARATGAPPSPPSTGPPPATRRSPSSTRATDRRRLDGSRFRHDLTDIPPPPEHVELDPAPGPPEDNREHTANRRGLRRPDPRRAGPAGGRGRPGQQPGRRGRLGLGAPAHPLHHLERDTGRQVSLPDVLAADSLAGIYAAAVGR